MAGPYAKLYIQLLKKLPYFVPKRLHQRSLLACRVQRCGSWGIVCGVQ